MMAMQMAQMQGQQQPIPGMGSNGGPPMDEEAIQQAQQVLQSPTWEEVIQLLRSDMQRGFRVDIETDSTIQNDIAKQQQNIGGFIQGFSSFVTAVGPAIEAGFMTMETATTLFKSFSQVFQLGKQAEDAIDEMAENPPPARTAPDPMADVQAQMQIETMKSEGQAKIEAGKAQAVAQLQAQKMQGDQAVEIQRLEAETFRERERIQFERQQAADKLAIDERLAVLQIQSQERIALIKAEQDQRNMEAAARLDEMKIAVQREQHAIDSQMAGEQFKADRESRAEQANKPPEPKPAEDKTGPALVAAIAGMTAVMDKMQQPKRVVRGGDGKVTGIE